MTLGRMNVPLASVSVARPDLTRGAAYAGIDATLNTVVPAGLYVMH